GRLNLACEPSDVALKLHQLGILICESLFKALATQLPPFDFGGIGSRLPDGGERRGFSQLRGFASCDLGDYGGVPRRSIGIRTKRQVFGDTLAEHFKLGLGAGTPRDSGFYRLLLLFAGRVEAGASRVEYPTLLLVFKPFRVDRGL